MTCYHSHQLPGNSTKILRYIVTCFKLIMLLSVRILSEISENSAYLKHFGLGIFSGSIGFRFCCIGHPIC